MQAGKGEDASKIDTNKKERQENEKDLNREKKWNRRASQKV